MSTTNHHTTEHHTVHHHKPRPSWRQEEVLLGAVGGLLAFALIYAVNGNGELFLPFAGALGMGAVLYTVVKLGKQHKL